MQVGGRKIGLWAEGWGLGGYRGWAQVGHSTGALVDKACMDGKHQQRCGHPWAAQHACVARAMCIVARAAAMQALQSDAWEPSPNQ